MQKTIDIAIGIFLIAITLSFLTAGNIFLNETASCYTLLFVGVMVICWLIFQIFRKNSKEKHVITTIDLAFILFLFWIILNSFLVKRGAVDPFLWHKLGAVAGFYLLVRLTKEKQFLLYSLVVSGIIQAVMAIGQSRGVLSGHHLMFDVTGSFGNPGQLGGYLAVCMTVSLCLLVANFREKKIIVSGLLLSGSVLQGVGLYLSDSRAGWVGLFVGLTTGIILVRKHEGAKARKETSGNKFALSTFRAFALLLVFAVGIMFLYSYRPKSADARVLIWRVSCDMIADRPLTGHGAGAFDEKYMLYQAAFFEQHPGSPLALVAGNAGYPFNELLNAVICFGIIGIVLLLFLFWAAFRKRTPLFQAGLSSWIAFSMFSYPTQVFPLLLLGIACLGSIEGDVKFSFKLPRWLYGTTILLLAAVLFPVWRDTAKLKRLSRELTGSYLNMDEDECSYDRMKFNSTFNNYYMVRLENQSTELYTDRIEDMFPSCEGYCMKGNYYLATGEREKAEQAFFMASNMVPTLIRPKYFLWKLYVEKGDTVAAKKMAETILNCPLKTESIYTLKVKKEVRKYVGLD